MLKNWLLPSPSNLRHWDPALSLHPLYIPFHLPLFSSCPLPLSFSPDTEPHCTTWHQHNKMRWPSNSTLPEKDQLRRGTWPDQSDDVPAPPTYASGLSEANKSFSLTLMGAEWVLEEMICCVSTLRWTSEVTISKMCYLSTFVKKIWPLNVRSFKLFSFSWNGKKTVWLKECNQFFQIIVSLSVDRIWLWTSKLMSHVFYFWSDNSTWDSLFFS